MAECELVNVKGGILGAFPEMKFFQNEFSLLPGDRLWFYTDGIPETKNSSNEMLGFETMKTLIDKTAHLSIHDACDYILDEVASFRREVPMEDDIVLIGCEVK
jgi:sigma-B regulation protein RsbU (phosphoserine phosphatase)